MKTIRYLMPFFGTLYGFAALLRADTVTAHFTSANTVPVTEQGYTATGDTLNLSLGFAPPVGTNLMVVKNTGLPFISGQLSNLAHGQTVELTFGEKTHRFIANYYGGSGNDLVLEWAFRTTSAWGHNGVGQLGNGTTTHSNVPVAIMQSGALAGKTVLKVSSGWWHNLALCSDGTLAAWGYNLYGQLGDGTNTDRNLPVPVHQSGVLAGKTVVAVSGGGSHSLALCSDGTIAAWGWTVQADGTNSSVPVTVNHSGALAGKTAVAVSGGGSHNLALCSDGTIVAWGHNFDGQLGNGTNTYSSVPVAVIQSGVLAGKTVVAVSGGDSHSLALCSDGTLAAWGDNYYGQLGNGTTTGSNVPVPVVLSGALAGKTVVAVSGGMYHSLALCSDGTLAAWGHNASGQLGNGTNIYSTVPIAVIQSGVLAGKSVTDVFGGSYHSLALCSDGTLVAWGGNNYGQLGNGTNTRSNVPVVVNQGVALAERTAVAAFGRQDHCLALAAYAPSSILASLSPNVGTLSPAFSSGTANYTLSVPHAATSIAFTPTATEPADTIKINGVTVASGTASPAIPLSPGENRITIEVSNYSTTTYTVVVTRSATADASFATADTIPFTAPTYNAAGCSVSLSLGFAPPVGTNLMVVKNTGLPFISGQFSNLAHGQTVEIPFGGQTYRFVANYHGGTGNDLVLEWPYRQVTAWGRNSHGQLGNGTNANTSAPAAIIQSGALAGKTVIQVSGGEYFGLALCSDGTLASWGGNWVGQLGNGTSTSSNVPVAINQSGALAGKTVVAVCAEYDFSIALCSDGTLAAWGNNEYGQLGDGTTFTRYTPVAVNPTGALAGKSVVAVAGGGHHVLALCSDGSIAAWGRNYEGQLGNGTYVNSTVPVSVNQSGTLAGKSVIAISGGAIHSLALCSDGTIAAWGSNGEGQLGDGTYGNRSVPVAVNQSGVLAGKSVITVSAGWFHSLALCSDGTIAAWGFNSSGQLGNGTYVGSNAPVAANQSGALAGKSVVAVAAGCYFSLAMTSDGTIVGWGNNDDGQLGNGSNTSSNMPVAVFQSGALDGKTVLAVNGGFYHSFALSAYAPSAALASLTSSTGTLNPVFDFSTSAYTLTVAQGTTSITLTPTAASPGTTIMVNGNQVPSGSASTAISLTQSPTSIAIMVTAADSSYRTYTVLVVSGAIGAWQADKFTPEQLADPAISGPMATPANDGINNLMKYALGLDPFTCGSGNLPTPGEDSGHLTLTFRQNKLATDIEFTVESGDDLGGWGAAGAEVSRTDGGDHWIVTVRDSVPIGSSSNRFMRLKVRRN